MNKKESLLSEEFLNKYKNKQPNWGFDNLGYVIFKRTYARRKEDGNLEEWHETIKRCIDGANNIGANYTKEESERLFDHIFNLRCSFSGRGLWQLGTKTVDNIGMDSLLNCWVTKVSEIEDFCFIFMESMLGGGVGVVISKEFTHELPRVKNNVKVRQKNTKDADFIVPDSKEGWCDLWRKTLEAYLITGKSFTYSTVCIRSSGEPIQTFGGIAPGPKPLSDGVNEICKILENRTNKKLRTQDVADIICCGGQVVKSGGVRRTALILLGDVDDAAYLNLKRWDLGDIPNYRSNSNNSFLCNNFEHLPSKFWDGYNGNGEPYGMVNIKNAKKYGRLGETEFNGFSLYDDGIIGFNPCQPKWATLLTPNGIKELGDINIGDSIWSKSGWTKVINKWSNGINKVLEYKTTAGTFYGTENHKLVSYNKKIEAKDCEAIDIITGPKNELDININPQDVMDGLVIGDGSVHEASNNFVHLCIGQDDYDYFSSEISPLIIKSREGVHDFAYEVTTTIKHDELPKTFERKVPNRFFYGSDEKVCSFLRGLYSANGSICGTRITLKASSFEIIKQVQIMLSSVGIKSYFTTNKENTVKFKNGEYLCKQSYDLNITSDRYRFYKLIGFIQKYKMDILEKLSTKYSNKSKSTFEIISIKEISSEEVFDITVDNESHTYWTGGCNVSNCAEATLHDKESCNLAEIFLNNISSKEEMLDCSKLLYKTQKAIAAGNYLHEATNKIVHKNMRLGLGITGICQKLSELQEWCDYTYKNLRKFDKEYSKLMNWPESIRLTVVKPSGTLSLLGGSSPGGHPAYAEHFIRRVRFSSNDPLLIDLRKMGYYIEPEIGFDGKANHDTLIVEFPCSFNKNTLISKNMSAIDQLELVKKLQTYWADQAVSVTVYYKLEELPLIKNWLSENYNSSVKSVSFLLHSEHGFKQAPLEEINKETYEKMKSKIKNVEFGTQSAYNYETDSVNSNVECAGGHCPIK